MRKQVNTFDIVNQRASFANREIDLDTAELIEALIKRFFSRENDIIFSLIGL